LVRVTGSGGWGGVRGEPRTWGRELHGNGGPLPRARARRRAVGGRRGAWAGLGGGGGPLEGQAGGGVEFLLQLPDQAGPRMRRAPRLVAGLHEGPEAGAGARAALNRSPVQRQWDAHHRRAVGGFLGVGGSHRAGEVPSVYAVRGGAASACRRPRGLPRGLAEGDSDGGPLGGGRGEDGHLQGSSG
jgi:hypothetical protein